MRIIGLGNALVDVLIQLPDDNLLHNLKLPKGSMQLIGEKDISSIEKAIKNISTAMVSGGSAANTIHGLAGLGTRCGYIGKVGNDKLGDFYKSDFIEASVSCMLFRSANPTGRAYTFITPDGERTFATYLGAAVELSSQDIDPEHYSGYDLLHIEGYLVQNTNLIEHAIKLAKENGLMVSLDLASYNVVEANIEFLSRIIPDYVDIVFANEEEAKAYTGKSPEEALVEIASNCNIAVVKVGKDGALIQAENDLFKISAIPTKVVDTTGAGDQFAAGFLHGLSENLGLMQCGQLGALMAGNVIQNYGARIPEDLWDTIYAEVKKIKH